MIALSSKKIADFLIQYWKRFNLSDLKIRTKINLFYLLLLIFSLAVSNYLYQRFYDSITSQKVSEVSVQMLYLINQNLNSIIDTANRQSKLILSNSDVQELLNNPHKVNDPYFRSKLETSLYSYMEAVPAISGIYLFDKYSREFSIDKKQLKKLNIFVINQADWFPEVTRLKGAYLLRLNAGGIFKQQKESNYISLIRIINDINTQTPIGVLVLNISGKVFEDSFEKIGNDYNTEIAIFNENDWEIINNHKLNQLYLTELLHKFRDKPFGSFVQKQAGRKYLVSFLHVEPYRWKIVSILPFAELSDQLKAFNLVVFILLAFNSLLLFSGSLLLSQMIATPVKKLLNSMKQVEKGEFEKVNISIGNDEFGQLQNGYNMMIEEIQKLIERVVDEQKTKRKAELDVLQAQIKPHFLYNTFDSISALALAGRNEDVYKVMKALGGYYRTSLNQGNEIIKIAEEIDLVKNYLIIQKFRYGNLFAAEYDLDPKAGEYKVLKLVLQPLVENAIYHGIKPKGEPGLIKIKTKLTGDQIQLIVQDDGVGFSETELERIEAKSVSGQKKSFGLRGTIERLRIFYGNEVSYRIETQKGNGTIITITIPCKE